MGTTAARSPASPPPARTGAEQRIVIPGVTWSQYVLVNDAIGTPGVRMAYCDGLLEIVTPSIEHEGFKKFIARLIETWAVDTDVPLYGYGSATFREEARRRGAEPDECWTVGERIDAFPHIVLEVVLTHGGLDRLDLYSGMRVSEVWFWLEGKFHLYRLEGQGYRPIESSRLLPGVDFAALAELVAMGDQHAAIQALRNRLRAR